MDKPHFVYVTYIKTTPEKLWQALTRSEFTTQYWFGTRWESDWKAGSPCNSYEANGTLHLTGKILESEPPRRLSFTFHPERAEVAQEAPSRVTYDLELTRGLVKLTVTHDQFATAEGTFKMIQNGWPQVLSNLKSLLENGAAISQTSECQHKAKMDASLKSAQAAVECVRS